MPDQPAPRPVTPRVDDTAADLGPLVAMGLVEARPTPQYAGLFVEPDLLAEPESE